MDHPCPACKAENDEDSAYCDQCGQPLSASVGAGQDIEGGCPKCGGVVENRGGGNGVCPACGTELIATAGAVPVPLAKDSEQKPVPDFRQAAEAQAPTIILGPRVIGGGNKMNTRQRIVLVLGAGALLIVLLSTGSYQRRGSLLLSAGTQRNLANIWNWQEALARAAMVSGAAAALYFAVGSRKS